MEFLLMFEKDYIVEINDLSILIHELCSFPQAQCIFKYYATCIWFQIYAVLFYFMAF